jgi:hypothetical protein
MNITLLLLIVFQAFSSLVISDVSVACSAVFVLWIVEVDPCFIPSDVASKKVITFVLIVNQVVLADIHVFTVVLCCELLGNLSCKIHL